MLINMRTCQGPWAVAAERKGRLFDAIFALLPLALQLLRLSHDRIPG